jgi:asparagine synthase (glutamine-hydrolysing)
VCGISGAVSIAGTGDPVQVANVTAMVAALAHRGPDDSGIARSGAAVFGMARLSIRGCQDGKQPIVDPETGVMVVCNGEIDNHEELRDWLEGRGRRVEQATDIAVIPGLYLELGEAFVERLIGAFAIAIWDPRTGKLLLVRDRVGERPLFFAAQEGVAVFASQVAAIVAGDARPLRPSSESLAGYLQSGYFRAPYSPFAEVEKVMPGELVAMDRNGIRRTRYWRLRFAARTQNSLDDFDAVFRKAVRRQSDVDAEFGLFLSGGLDSSLVAAVTRSLHPEKRLRAYGLRFHEDSYDEGQYAVRVAESLGIEYTSIWVRPEDFPVTLADLIRKSGEPLADPAWVPTALLARRAAEDVRVALVGEGADELFGGYPTYFGAKLAEYYSRLPDAVRSSIRRLVEGWPASDKKVALSFLLKRFVQGDGLDFLARHALWTAAVPPAVLRRLGAEPAPFPGPDGVPAPVLDRLQQHDLETSLAEGLLTKADRASMRSALELRAPFLDLGVVEFAAGLPGRERVSGIRTKVLLKRYALRYLPRDIVHRKKRGLSVPLSIWLRGPLYEWAESRLSCPGIDAVGIDRRAAVCLLEEHRDRKVDHARTIWTLVVLGEWLLWWDSSGNRP